MNKQIGKVVNKILVEDAYARKDDDFLMLKVVQELRPDIAGTTFANVMLNLKNCSKDKQISLESITRARRKWQEENPELKDSEAENARRIEEENYYAEYSKHVSLY